jgi:hypothetical protein
MHDLLDPSLRREMRFMQPTTVTELHAYVSAVLGFFMPPRAMVDGHVSPLAYLEHAFFEDRLPRDAIVWANRGGGKTQLGAIATLLDLLFKPGIQIRILGGSFDQSSKMYRYLRQMLEGDVFRDLVAGNLTGRHVELINGSRVEVLSQSERAVRGQRVHKLRCDEVELFDEHVWEAAQMVTRSGQCGEIFVPGAIETLSTMHRPFGMMQRLVRDNNNRRRIMRWSVLDVLERCPPQRDCETCPLWDDCLGRAKHASGFVLIDDAIQQRKRVGKATWRAEMLCIEPDRTASVYPEFSRKAHVLAFDAPSANAAVWIGGIDFGYRDPTVILWAFLTQGDVLHVIDESVTRELTAESHIEIVRSKPWPTPRWFGADPAGHQRSEQTGASTISIWKRAGFSIRTRRFDIEPGIMAVRARLKRADGSIALVIHPRCRELIEAMLQYHYPPHRDDATLPVKDGHDHAADALRYLITNLDRTDQHVRIRQC